jgi:hypothetical protein
MSDPATIDHDPDKTARKKRRRFAVMSWLASSLILVLALVATSPYWAVPLASILPWGAGGNSGGVALGGRLDAVEQKLAAIPGQPAPGVTPDLTGIEDKLQDQAAALGKLQDSAQRLDQRLASLEARIAGMSDDPQRLLLVSLSELSAAMGTSRPFAGELAASEALALGKPDTLAQLKTLDGAAATGIPGAAVLARQFSAEVAPALMRAGAETNSAGESWWQRILARIESLVVIRRTDQEGEKSADPVTAAVAMAEAALDQGDIAGAVGAVEGLPEETAAPALPWLALARQRLAAEAAVAQAIQSASQAMTATTPGAKTP